MTVATLNLTGTWLTDPSNPSVSLHLVKADRAEQDTLTGSVRVFAGGRRRIILTPADTRQSTLTFQRVSEDDLATLRGWRGRVLLLRDWQGWRRWGTYFDLQPKALGGVDNPYQVQITWLDCDYDEGVL